MNLKIVGRLLLATLLALVFSIPVTIAAIAILIISGKQYPGALALGYSIPIVLSCSPAFLITCLTVTDSKATRASAAIRAIFVTLVLTLAWQVFLGPAIGSMLPDTPGKMQIAGGIDSFVNSIVLLVCGYLTALWLPSLTSKAVGPAPATIRKFERTIFASLVLGLINMIFSYNQTLSEVQERTKDLAASDFFGGAFVVSISASAMISVVFMVLMISRSGSKAMRIVFVGSYALGLPMSVLRLSNFFSSPLSGTLVVLVLALQGYGIHLLYRRESSDWLDGTSKSEHSTSALPKVI